MTDKTVGKLCEELKQARPDWVNIGGGMVARYEGSVKIDPDTGEWEQID